MVLQVQENVEGPTQTPMEKAHNCVVIEKLTFQFIKRVIIDVPYLHITGEIDKKGYHGFVKRMTQSLMPTTSCLGA